jgi:DNA-3-methyladenine glycosylase II
MTASDKKEKAAAKASEPSKPAKRSAAAGSAKPTAAEPSLAPPQKETEPLTSAIHPGAEKFLAALGPRWKALVEAVGPIAHKTRPGNELWEELARSVAYQQLRASSAEAMLGRLRALAGDSGGASGLPGAERLAEMGIPALRSCGFSETKAHAIVSIAKGSLDGSVPSREEALRMSDEELIEKLVALRGVGRWTVEMLLIYSLERMDVWPADDFGVREGWRFLHGLERQPTPSQLRAQSEPLKPYRTLAAWYLWRTAMMPDHPKNQASQPGSDATPKAKKKGAKGAGDTAQMPAKRKDQKGTDAIAPARSKKPSAKA